MGSTPHSIQSLLHAAPGRTADLLARARGLTRIRAALLAVLPAAAAAHLQVAACEGARLTLHVDNGGWATRLHYLQSDMTRALAQRLRLHVETVDIRVRRARAATQRPPTPREISAANRRRIEQVASYVDDPKLADALTRLARAGAPPAG